ncbi:uncharacterized protein [Temnothorax nylanderi]|uniref:uncharacterized protein n=1 Tax=Temnothorax nylanderi TaxID=102681 RepID=UPI003A8442D6
MEFRAKVTMEKETMEKLIRDQAKEILRGMKEEIRDQREEIERLRGLKEEIREQREEMESLRRKVQRLEQGAGKRKRDASTESRCSIEEKKWWPHDEEKDEDERRRKNIIIRIEKSRWLGKGTNWEKVRRLLSEDLEIKVEVMEVSVIGLRGEWMTMLVRLGSEKEKWRALDARRKAGSRLKVKMDEDKTLERRIREGGEMKKRKEKERREEDGERPKDSEEEEISSRLEESLLMDTEKSPLIKTKEKEEVKAN